MYLGDGRPIGPAHSQGRSLRPHFGNLISSSGSLASTNTYRFSSKEFIPNVGIYYYLYRFYEPGLQRWLNRDPVSELGFRLLPHSPILRHIAKARFSKTLRPNLFRFVLNDPLRRIDPLGLADEYSCADLAAAAYDAWVEGDVWAYQTINDMMDQLGCFDPPSPPPSPSPKPFPIWIPPPNPFQNNCTVNNPTWTPPGWQPPSIPPWVWGILLGLGLAGVAAAGGAVAF
jgi:RHS repeat-associated protein